MVYILTFSCRYCILRWAYIPACGAVAPSLLVYASLAYLMCACVALRMVLLIKCTARWCLRTRRVQGRLLQIESKALSKAWATIWRLAQQALVGPSN